jgi:hypothetical protein
MNNREFRIYTTAYWVAAMIGLMLVLLTNWIYWERTAYGMRAEVIRQTLLIAGIGFIVLLILYGIGCLAFGIIYRKLSRVSEQMRACLLDEQLVIQEEYESGEMGRLYSNFRKMMQALREAQGQEQKEKQFLKEVISDISHQLKTPLAALTIFLDLLSEKKLPTAQEEQKIFEESKNQLGRMEWMVLSMLKLARIEAGAIQFARREVSLGLLLNDSVAALRVRYEEKQQKVIVNCPDELVYVLDADWMQEALVNLIKNAIDYTPVGGIIEVSAQRTEVYMRIIVKDNGIGISEEDIPHIFERFRRGGNNTNSNSVGIGLALTKSIVEGQGGKIHVDSEVNQYTKFTITFVGSQRSRSDTETEAFAQAASQT